MTEFDASDDAQISRAIGDQVERSRLGRIVEVFEHVQDTDTANFEVDVELMHSIDKQHRAIPFVHPQNDEIKPPKVGDKVVVDYFGESSKSAIARGAFYTNQDRPPLGRAGMWRKKVPSGTSPAGAGDLYVESYTAYDVDPARPEFDEDSATIQNSFIRLSKKENDQDNPVDGDTLPMMVELFDSPNDDTSEIRIEGNEVDGNTNQSMNATLDLKNGTIVVQGANGTNDFQLEIDVVNQTAKVSGDGTNEMGMSLNFANDSFKLLDGDGYGLVSDGSGNFTMHYESWDWNQGTTTTL